VVSKTIAVTGAGGYIGSILVEQLLDAGHRVRAIDRFFFGRQVLAPVAEHPHLEVEQNDIRALERGDLAGCDAVIDLAALSNDPSCDLDPELTRDINERGRIGVARAARDAGVPRYVFASSCSVYGSGAGSSLVEDGPVAPLTTYAKSCLAAERAILELETPRFAPTVLRNATVFGVSPRMRFDLVVNLMTASAFSLGRITIVGGGRQWRPLVHVRDVAKALALVIDHDRATVGGRVFNIGAVNAQIRSLAYTVRETLPVSVDVQTAPDDDDRRSYHVSFERARADLGFVAERSIGTGVREVYEALKAGEVEQDERSKTVAWYRYLLRAKQILAEVELEGRLL